MVGLVASCSNRLTTCGKKPAKEIKCYMKEQKFIFFIHTSYDLLWSLSIPLLLLFPEDSTLYSNFHQCSVVIHKFSPLVKSKHYLIWYRNHTANFFWHFLNPQHLTSSATLGTLHKWTIVTVLQKRNLHTQESSSKIFTNFRCLTWDNRR